MGMAGGGPGFCFQLRAGAVAGGAEGRAQVAGSISHIPVPQALCFPMRSWPAHLIAFATTERKSRCEAPCGDVTAILASASKFLGARVGRLLCW